MDLEDEVKIIRYLSKNIVNNTLDIGFRLKKIRDNQSFLPKYNSFTDMLKNEDLGFKYSEGFISRLLQLVEDPKLVELAKKIGPTKTIELLYVPDREARNAIADKAVKENLSFRDIRRETKKISPEKQPLLSTPDESYMKLLREYHNFGAEIIRLTAESKELYDNYVIWEEKALKEDRLKEQLPLLKAKIEKFINITI